MRPKVLANDIDVYKRIIFAITKHRDPSSCTMTSVHVSNVALISFQAALGLLSVIQRIEATTRPDLILPDRNLEVCDMR